LNRFEDIADFGFGEICESRNYTVRNHKHVTRDKWLDVDQSEAGLVAVEDLRTYTSGLKPERIFLGLEKLLEKKPHVSPSPSNSKKSHLFGDLELAKINPSPSLAGHSSYLMANKIRAPINPEAH
jgi:hypothetical protein